MKKTLFLLSLFSILCLVACAKLTDPKAEDRFRSITPQYEVKDYQFIADGNGIVIDWKITNKWELFWHSKVAQTERIATSKDFLVASVFKLRDESLTTESGSDEYLYIDIFDLRTSPIQKKRLDLWALVPEDLKEDYALFTIADNRIFVEDGRYYVAAFLEMKESVNNSLGRVDPSVRDKYMKINLETGQVEGVLKREEVSVKNPLYYWLDTDIDNLGVKKYSTSFEKTENYDGQINLAVTDKKAAQLFSKKTARAYQLLDIEDQTVKNNRELIDLQTQFLPIGTDIYDVAEFTLRYSRDDKEVVRVTSFEEFEQYYREERLAEEERLRQRREEMANEQNQEGN